MTDFGVSRALINEVFVDSGLEGDAVDLVEGRFGNVRPEWLHDNHFHSPARRRSPSASAPGRPGRRPRGPPSN
ncbi:DUF6716 putative glycosyltransferase [Curtobacterium sp. Csp2]|uniref:DUF6716 putative glycosyltransferase n=1 Tax=Curtobacterium sp. Csp2 TaxID=2495430 RepID=UPI0034A0C650